MRFFRFKTVFSKLFTSVMLTLVIFAVCMIALTHLVHDNSASTRWQVLSSQIVNQIDPFVDELDNATTTQDRLQARFMLAVIKKSFDIFDESLDAKMGLYDQSGHLLIQTDNSDLPDILPNDPMWLSRMMPALSEPINNAQATGDRGYTLLFEPRDPPKPSQLSAMFNLFTGTLILLLLMTVLLWWIAHSMTWRINQMSQQIIRLGEGDFSVRVPVKGTDEIAGLARGFNQSAKKIEHLISANSLILAHASHELRTPITRIRLQTEMMQMLTDHLSADSQTKFTKRIEAVNRDLTGLNDLVESILLVSRLDAGHAAEQTEVFDLYELAYQECQHYPVATLQGEPLNMSGQPKLMMHVIRNLLNNATIHGTPPVTVQVYGAPTTSQSTTMPDHLLANRPQSTEPMQSHAHISEVSDEPNAFGSVKAYLQMQKQKRQVTDVPADHLVEQPASALADDVTKPASAKKQKTKSKETKASRQKIKRTVDYRYAVLAVIDGGNGVPLDKRKEIFNPFVRLKQEKKGSGLGLSLVAQIVEAHGGYIHTDTLDGNTRFLVVLPIQSVS